MKRRFPRIAYISTFPPKKCGLATYTRHLRESILSAKGDSASPDLVIPVCLPEERAVYEQSGMQPMLKNERSDYAKTAERINQSDVALVSLQHEFGIYGGEAGAYVLELLQKLQKPVVTTFHTVFDRLTTPYSALQQEIARLSKQIIVMNRRGIHDLHTHLSVPLDKIMYIPHGAPQHRPFAREATRRILGWEGRKVMLTFGLLGRSKGIELVLQAMASAVKAVPDILYVIAGQTHPEVVKHEGEAYRLELAAQIAEAGLANHVQWMDRYIPEDELAELLAACDLYITPYPGMGQITSGTLAYAAGLGRPILSTPYSYAKDLLQGHEEMLLAYGDVAAWSNKLIALFSQPDMLRTWETTVAAIGRPMQWPQVGAEHLRLFRQVAKLGGAISDVG